MWHYEAITEGRFDPVEVAFGIEPDQDAGGSAYQNSNIVNGKIQGKMPQYIKRASGEFLPVTITALTFYGCTNLVEAPKIPSTVTSTDSMFEGCTSLSKAPMIPNGVENIRGMFKNCTNLASAPNIPDSVTYMQSTFSGCTNLTSASIGNGVENMDNTFSGCIRLTTVPNIPTTVTHLNQAFYGCTGLTEVPRIWERVTSDTTTYQGQPWGNGCFEGCTNASNYADIPNYWKTHETLKPIEPRF